MQRNPLAAGWLGGLTLLLGVTGITGAQESFAFEYRPSERILVQSIVESEGELLFIGLGELPDSARGQTTSTAGISRRAVPSEGARYTLRVMYDSVRAQYRAEQDTWVDFPLSWDGGLWAEYVADRQMALTGPVRSNDTSAVAVVRAASAEPHLVLPQGYVAVGQEWSSTIIVPFTTLDSALPGRSAWA